MSRNLRDLAKDGNELTFISHGVNWNWYLTVKVVWPHGKMKVEILRHWCLYLCCGGDHPDTVGTFSLLENTSRTVCAVRLSFIEGHTPDVFAVENPRNVFSYVG